VVSCIGSRCVASIYPDVKAAELKDRSRLPIVRQEVLRLRVLPWFLVKFFRSGAD
jgi:hypothetical protein